MLVLTLNFIHSKTLYTFYLSEKYSNVASFKVGEAYRNEFHSNFQWTCNLKELKLLIRSLNLLVLLYLLLLLSVNTVLYVFALLYALVLHHFHTFSTYSQTTQLCSVFFLSLSLSLTSLTQLNNKFFSIYYNKLLVVMRKIKLRTFATFCIHCFKVIS